MIMIFDDEEARARRRAEIERLKAENLESRLELARLQGVTEGLNMRISPFRVFAGLP